MIIAIILVIVGFFLLIKGADFLVDGASTVAKKFKISEMVIGLTVVALGTSMPELMVSLTGALGGHADISLGNIIGSNLANILLILGICALISRIEISKETKWYENPINLFITIVLLVLCVNGGLVKAISQPEGIILLVLFALFLAYVFYMAKKDKNEELALDRSVDDSLDNIGKRQFLFACIKILGGIVFLKYGADFVVDNASKIAEIIGISEKIIGLTIVAIGTSLPELVASVTAVVKHENDMAVGNILGSNIFNILFILGVSSVITPINYSISYNLDIFVLIFTGILLLIFPFIGKTKNYLGKWHGAIFLVMYIIYLITLIFVS